MDSTTIIVGAGTTAGGTFTLGRVTYVSQASPAVISTSNPAIVNDGAVTGILSIPNSAGVYNAIAGATEMLRVQGGAIISGAGLDSVQIGRTAVAGAVGTVAIGRGASDGGGQQGVYIGELAIATNASGIAIGETAAINGNAGGSLGIAIGAGASATSTSAGNGFSLAIGGNAVAKDGDTVVGYSATSSVAGNGNGNAVFGALATINVSLGAGTAIGASSSIGAKWGVAVGQGATIGTGVDNVTIGQVATITGAAANCVVIGQNSTVSASQQIVLGSDGLNVGANTCQIGTPGTIISTFVLGQGDTVATPGAITIRFTNGTGANNAAGNLTIVAPLSTSNGAVASIIFQNGLLLTTGSVLQTATTNLTLSSTGAAGSQVPLATFAGNVGMQALTATTGTFSGTIGIGTSPISQRGIFLNSTLTGSVSQAGATLVPTFDSGATSDAEVIYARLSTSAAAFTLTSGYGLFVDTPTKGAGSTITTAIGLYIAAQTQGGTNYAIFTNAGLVQLGGATNVAGDFSVATSKFTVASASGNTVVAGAVTLSSTLSVDSGTGTAGALTIAGTSYGAGVASLRLNGLTTAATNNLVGTLTNSPVTGNPSFWMPISIAGAIKYIPCFG